MKLSRTSPDPRDLGAQVRKAQVRGLLFNKPSPLPKIERFTLLEQIGVGGMSEVFAAYDDRLDRKIAIKLVRSGNDASVRASERLLREAQTLARLSHPNVVHVYDAGRFEDRVYLAMEFIRGQALNTWLTKLKAPSPRARQRMILRHLIAAGRGISAAHQAGLTHRDIKPSNIVVGTDGRARVLDFGIARVQPAQPDTDRDSTPTADAGPGAGNDPTPSHESAAHPRTAESGSFETTQAPRSDGAHKSQASPAPPKPISHGKSTERLTPKDAVMGTPAYMAPELFDGQRATTSSDQFSFCVTAYEALCGARPYESTSIEAVRAGTLDSSHLLSGSQSAGVPAVIRKALIRGLAPEPEHRYEGMDQLLDALGAWPRRHYLPWLLIGLALVGLAIATLVSTRSSASEPACTGAERELAQVWNGDRSAGLQRHFVSSGHKYAEQTWQLVSGNLRRYTDAWQQTHRDACQAHREGRQSDTTLDRRMSCLQRRRATLDSALQVIQELDGDALPDAADVVGKLPSIAYCSDVEALAADVPPPEEPVVAARVVELRERLGRAQALHNAGRYLEAYDLSTELLASAEPLKYLPVTAEILLLKGQASLRSEEDEIRASAIGPLSEAVTLAFRSDHRSLAIEALARLVYARGIQNQLSISAVELASLVAPQAEQVPGAKRVQALLLNNLGVAYNILQRPDRARPKFERALEVAERDAPRMALVARQNLLMLIEDPAVRTQLRSEISQQVQRTYGIDHPRTLEYRIHAATFTDDLKAAHELLKPACTGYRSGPYRNGKALFNCLQELGFLTAELGDEQLAARHLSEALAVPLPSGKTDVAPRARMAGYAELYEGRPELALAHLRHALTHAKRPPESWWEKADLGDIYLGVGLAEQLLGRHEPAIDALARALSMYSSATSKSIIASYRHRMARTQVALAQSLSAHNPSGARSDSSDIRARIVALGEAAETWYRRTGHQRRLRELRGWRARLGEMSQPDSLEAAQR